jgi:genome maintenance exonuclease 1
VRYKIDFKFSDRPKPIYEDKILPLAAYIGALNRQYGPPFRVSIKQALLVVATPEGVDATLYDANQVNKYWQKWQQRVAQFWEEKRAIA